MCLSFQHQGKLGLRLNEISARDDHCKTLLNRMHIYCGSDSIAIAWLVHNPHDGYKWAFFSFRFWFRFHILEELMHNLETTNICGYCISQLFVESSLNYLKVVWFFCLFVCVCVFVRFSFNLHKLWTAFKQLVSQIPEI